MSYILDALRKSEHERQMATGRNASLLYPIEMKRSNKPWLILMLLALAALVIAAFIWWLGLRPAATPAPAITNPPVIIAAPKPQIIPEQPQTLPEKTLQEAKPQPRPPEHAQKERAQKKIPIPSYAGTQPKPPVSAEPVPSAPATVHQAVTADPLQGLPALNITGYLQNEQGASVAMINNKLVHEGEEISPGLRLVKILDGSAVFSYKGYLFSR